MSGFQKRVKQHIDLKNEITNQQNEKQKLLDSTIPSIYGIIFTDIGKSFSYNRWKDMSSFHHATNIEYLGNDINWDFKDYFLEWLNNEFAKNELENFTEEVEEDSQLKEFFLGSHSEYKVSTIKTDENSGILLMNEFAAKGFKKDSNFYQYHTIEIVSAVLSLLEKICLRYGLSPFYRRDDKSAHDIATCIICGCPDNARNPDGININAQNVSVFFDDIKTFIKQKKFLEMPGTRAPFFKDPQYNGTAKQAAAYYSNVKDVRLRLLNGQYGFSADEAKNIIEQCELRYPCISAIAYTCEKCGTNAADAEIYKCDECGAIFCSKCTPIKREFKLHHGFKEKYLQYGLYKCPVCGESSDRDLSNTCIHFLIEDQKEKMIEQ